jgi:hypothetical protein
MRASLRFICVIIAVAVSSGCGHDQHGAAGPAPTPPPVQPDILVADVDLPRRIVLEAGTIYWTSDGDQTAGSLGSIHALPGGGGTPLVLAQSACPTGIAVDGGNLYFTDWCDKSINVVPKTGGAATRLVDADGLPDSIVSDGTFVYWANFGQAIRRVSTGGGPYEEVALFAAERIALDQGRLFALDFNGVVARIALTDFAVATLAPAIESAGATTMRLDRSDVYVSSINARQLWRVAKDEPHGPEVLLDGTQVLDLALDDRDLYFVQGDGSVIRQPKQGGAPTSVHQPDERSVDWVEVDDDYVYWESRVALSSSSKASFYRLPKPRS